MKLALVAQVKNTSIAMGPKASLCFFLKRSFFLEGEDYWETKKTILRRLKSLGNLSMKRTLRSINNLKRRPRSEKGLIKTKMNPQTPSGLEEDQVFSEATEDSQEDQDLPIFQDDNSEDQELQDFGEPHQDEELKDK